MQLTIRTLGTLDASTTDAHGAVRTLSRGKPVAMLAYLACIPGQKASREHLAALLWGDVESDAARQNLRQTLWYLKKKLGDGLLDGTGEVIALASAVTCDRDDFLQAAQRGDFAAAVRRHLGPFIPDFAAPGAAEFERWCELERRRLMVTYLRCADALARQWLSEGKFRDAQELARRARDADPMDQATWRLLLETLVAGSDALGAMSEAEHFEAFLAREEQELEAASVSAIRLAQRVATAPRTPETGPASSIAAELVGREAEFSRILAAWEQARQGTPRALVISAAAGLGKSRLLRDVQARLRASRARCVLVRANPGDRQLTGGFAAEVAAQLAALPGSAAVSLGTASVLVALAPALASTYPAAGSDRSDGEEALRRRVLALVELARVVSDEHPVAVLLDDLHWADHHSARVIAAALTRSEHARVLVVLAKRPGTGTQTLFTEFERIELPPLDLAAVTAFVSHVADLPSAPWAEMLPQQLLLATGGSPLLLVETLHGALERGLLTVTPEGDWSCANPHEVTEAFREGSAVRQRVLRLAPEMRHALLALALFGRPVDISEARALMPGQAVNVEEPIEALERGGFVSRAGTQVMVAHDAIADTVMELADPDHRRRVHGGIARYLGADGSDENSLKRAAEHARAAEDHALLADIWRRFLVRRRRAGDRRSTALIAAELLGEDPASPAVVPLTRAAPLRHRRRARWVAAAMLAVATLTAAATFVTTRSAPSRAVSSFVFTLPSEVAGDPPTLVEVRVDPEDDWNPEEPLLATEVNPSRYPAHLPGRHGPLTRLPDGVRWWGASTDSVFGDEPVLFDSLGVAHLIAKSMGDDGIGSVSPDGRQFAALTARFDTLTDHMQLITMGLHGERVRRLTFTGDYDRNPSWRPDGTQIAVSRHYYSAKRNDAICLVDVDGAHERCFEVPQPNELGLIGWLDNRRLALLDRRRRIYAFDTESQQLAAISGITGQLLTLEGRYRACLCLVDANATPSVFIMRAGDPASARPVLFRGTPLRGTLAYGASTYSEREWLDTLRLTPFPKGVSLDNVHRIAIEGRRANGAPVRLHDLHWTSRDTSVAVVDSTGRLRPRRLGTAWIVVSAGGWRTDSLPVQVVPPSAQTRVTETWSADWLSRWQPFGVPAAVTVHTPRGMALLPNGDGSYPSGAYLRRAFPSSEGFGFEADVSLPITAAQWQSLGLHIAPVEQLGAFRRWDLKTGAAKDYMPLCDFGFPGGEGAMNVDFFTLSTPGEQQKLESPRGIRVGWHRVRLQLLPDGRCAVSIDGEPQSVSTPHTGKTPDSTFITIIGHERFGGRLVVGRLEAWSGVRGGVDWTRLDADTGKKVRTP